MAPDGTRNWCQKQQQVEDKTMTKNEAKELKKGTVVIHKKTKLFFRGINEAGTLNLSLTKTGKLTAVANPAAVKLPEFELSDSAKE